MSKFLLSAALAMGPLFSTNVWAEEESFTSYDSIVNELKASSEDQIPSSPAREDFDWQEVALHGGLALATSWVSTTAPDGTAGSGLMKGLEINFGMNLFTRKLRAEGGFTTYAQEQLQRNLRADLKEFELRVIYLPSVRDGMTMRFGAGLAARYMNLESQNAGQTNIYQSSTPSSLFLLGFERKISSTVTIGPDVSYRSAIVSDTFDKSAWDASFRLNATF